MTYLKELDFFKMPVRFYHTRGKKKSHKKIYQMQFGSYFGVCLSSILVMIISVYAFFRLWDIHLGNLDWMSVE